MLNSITIGLNLPNEVKEKTPWKNSQFSVLQYIPTTCYCHNVQTQAALSKISIRMRKEEELLKKSRSLKCK